MNLTSLTNPSLINLQTTFDSRDAAIEALAEQLNQQGKLHNKEEYLQAVFAREEQGPTALGEGLAVPHGKTDAVKDVKQRLILGFANQSSEVFTYEVKSVIWS